MKVIRIVGNIGSGKSTLLNKLRYRFPNIVLHEPVEENPILSLYYSDPPKMAVAMQAFMEDYYYQRLKEITAEAIKQIHETILTDYGITDVFTNMIYRDGMIDTLQYWSLVKKISMFTKAKPKEIFLYLPTEPEECHRRMIARGRDFESVVPLKYLKSLDLEYKKYLEKVKFYTWNDFDEGLKYLESEVL